MFKGSPAHVSALPGPATGADIRPVITDNRRRGRPCRLRFLSPFGHRPSLLGHPVPAGNSALLTVGLPGIAWTMTGFPRSTHSRHDRIGRPLYPETKLCSHDRSDLSGRRSPPLPTARSCHPGQHPISRSCPLRGIIKGSLSFARPVFPSSVDPPDGTGPLGLSPGLRTPTGKTCGARQGGDGYRALTRSYASDIVGPPFRELTRTVRPRVARSAWT